MADTMTTFAPVRIGISPAGCEWVAYKPQNVEPMRARLATTWARSIGYLPRSAEEALQGIANRTSLAYLGGGIRALANRKLIVRATPESQWHLTHAGRWVLRGRIARKTSNPD